MSITFKILFLKQFVTAIAFFLTFLHEYTIAVHRGLLFTLKSFHQTNFQKIYEE